MSEMAEGVLEGIFCQFCGALIDGESPGYVRTCLDCFDVPDEPEVA